MCKAGTYKRDKSLSNLIKAGRAVPHRDKVKNFQSNALLISWWKPFNVRKSMYLSYDLADNHIVDMKRIPQPEC